MNAPQCAHARAIVVRNDNWRIALEEALHGVFTGRRTGPDLLIMFASSAYSDHYPEMVREARRFVKLNPTERTQAIGRIQASVLRRFRTMDNTLARPESGWLAAFRDLELEESGKPTDLADVLASIDTRHGVILSLRSLLRARDCSAYAINIFVPLHLA